MTTTKLNPAPPAARTAGSQQQVVLRHRWIIHYGNERGESWHHMTAFDHEVREITAKALAAGMISLTVLRTTNPLP